MHFKIKGQSGTGKIYHNDIRADMEEAARLFSLDFSIQTIINGKRQVIGIYAGDVVDAFSPAVEYANESYKTVPVKNADVVIVNVYPGNVQVPGFEWAANSLRPGGTGIFIWQHPLGKATLHYRDERRDFTGKSFWENTRVGDPVSNAGQSIIFSQYIQHRDVMKYPKDKVKVAKTWEEVLALLKKAHGPSTNVAVYPYVGIQHEPITLDKP